MSADARPAEKGLTNAGRRRGSVAAIHRAAHLGVRGGFRRPDGHLAHGPGREVNAERLVKVWATVSSRHLRLLSSPRQGLAFGLATVLGGYSALRLPSSCFLVALPSITIESAAAGGLAAWAAEAVDLTELVACILAACLRRQECRRA
jgi:hypothetical protein